MSLIDIKHFAAPFRNTVHLVSIVFIVLLFAVYRLATGGIDVADKTPTTRDAALGTHSTHNVPSPAAENTGLENDIQRLLTGGKANSKPSEGAGSATPPKDSKDQSPRDFDEIERELGLKQ